MTETVHPVDRLVGNNVRMLRTLRGISQSSLGEQVGVTFQQIQKYEKGVNRVSASMLFDIARVPRRGRSALLRDRIRSDRRRRFRRSNL